jgi:hypothetical protein
MLEKYLVIVAHESCSDTVLMVYVSCLMNIMTIHGPHCNQYDTIL